MNKTTITLISEPMFEVPARVIVLLSEVVGICEANDDRDFSIILRSTGPITVGSENEEIRETKIASLVFALGWDL